MMEDLNLFNLTKEERNNIYNIYLYYYSYVRHTESCKTHRDNGDEDGYTLEYDLAHLAGWEFRNKCKELGVKVVFKSTNESHIELYKLGLEDFLENRRIE